MNIHDFILGKIVGYGKSITDTLINKFGSSKKILDLPNDKIVPLLYKAKIREDTIKKFLEGKEEYTRDKNLMLEKCYSEIKELRENHRIYVISFSDSNYPLQLKKIKGIPLNIYVKGNINFDYSRSIAIAGTRNVSPFAKEKVAEISKDLANAGFCIISGLARGVDGQAHSSVVFVNKKTIAVLPYLSDKIYPPEHEQLAREILSNGGALISENFSKHKIYDPFLFTDRNRIISGLSKAALIVEGSVKSGSFSQYNRAKSQNKIIFTLKPKNNNEETFLPRLIVEEGGSEIESAKEIINILNEDKKIKNYYL